MEQFKRIVVNYRTQVPLILEKFVNSDKQLNLTKDGLHDTSGGIKHYRVLIGMEWSNSHSDQAKLNRLEQLLDELENNNQIISYSRIN